LRPNVEKWGHVSETMCPEIMEYDTNKVDSIHRTKKKPTGKKRESRDKMATPLDERKIQYNKKKVGIHALTREKGALSRKGETGRK